MRAKAMELFVIRGANRRRTGGRWRRRLKVGVGVMIALMVSAAIYEWLGQITAAAALTRSFVVENPYFSVKEIQVRGGDKVGGSEIVSMAGLRHGMNLWRIEPGSIEKKVAKHPWVRRVLVRREFPRRVVIEVEERTPMAIVALGKLYYVDGDGVVFKEVGRGENVNFPLLTGLHPAEVTASEPATRRRIQDAIRLGELMAKDSHSISEIHFDAPDRLVLYTMAYPVALHMGWGDWGGKLRRLDRVLTLWRGNEQRLAALDLSFRDQVVARVRHGRQ